MKRSSLLLAAFFISLTITAQTKKIQPFTGAMTIEDGIRYDQLEIKVNDDLLLAPDIPINEKFTIRISKPWSFIADAKGNVHPGVGFKITDTKGQVITATNNIYEKDTTGVNPNYLKALSLSITLDEKMKVGDSLVFYAKFFDTKNNDSLLVILPCRVVAKGKAQNLHDWNSFSSTYGASGMFVDCKIDKFKMTKTYAKKVTETTVDSIKLSIDTLGGFVLKNKNAFLNASYTLYDNNFKVVEHKLLFENAAAGLSAAQLQKIQQVFILPAGFKKGIARVQVSDNNGKGKLDAVLDFVY